MAVRKIREGVSLPSWKRASEVQINKGACKPIKVDEPDKEKEHAIDVQTLKAYFKQKEKKMQQSKDAKKMKLSENSVAEGFTYTDKVAEGFDYVETVKEDTPTVDNTAPADKNKESTYKIYGWTLEVTYPDNRLYSGPRYWLYNPSGYGGSLQFYYAPEEIAQARADGKQVVGFEGNTLPKTLLDTLIKKYIRGDFDNRQLALENKQETATKLLKECECDYFDSISDTEYRLATLRELGYADIADRFEELLCKEKEKRETINSLLDLLLNSQPSEPVADPIAEPTPDTDDLNMVVEPTDEIPDEVPNDENKEEVEDDNKDSRE